MSETAQILQEPSSTVRYWADKFEHFVKPDRTNKGNRRFTPDGLEVLKHIKHLTEVEGMTLEGVARELRDGRRTVTSDVRVLEALKDIRARLVEIKKLV